MDLINYFKASLDFNTFLKLFYDIDEYLVFNRP